MSEPMECSSCGEIELCEQRKDGDLTVFMCGHCGHEETHMVRKSQTRKTLETLFMLSMMMDKR